MIPAVVWFVWGQFLWLLSVLKAIGGLAWLVRLAVGVVGLVVSGREGVRHG